MELEVRTTLPPELEAHFSLKANEAGVATYVQQLIIADLQKPRSVAEILAPFRTEVEQCDITDDELDALVEEIREDIYQERLANERASN